MERKESEQNSNRKVLILKHVIVVFVTMCVVVNPWWQDSIPNWLLPKDGGMAGRPVRLAREIRQLRQLGQEFSGNYLYRVSCIFTKTLIMMCKRATYVRVIVNIRLFDPSQLNQFHTRQFWQNFIQIRKFMTKKMECRECERFIQTVLIAISHIIRNP